MTPEAADRDTRNSALTLALTLPGDTVLYLLLPLHAAVFGVTLPEAGLLLAANRLVRIAGCGWVARFYADRGPRAACMLAAGGAALATTGYALLSGVTALLAARLLWGLAYAAMNIAVQALPTALPDGAERRSGWSRSIVAAGPMIGLAGGALLMLGGGGALLWLGALSTVLLRAVVQPLPGPIVAAENPGGARVPALARQATWRDIGAGAGPLLAGLLFPVLPALAIYGGAAALLTVASLAVRRPRSRASGQV
ncbi:hypothetical protein [Muricoccus aerilatus]|uniref:hypothetical protein n=1 Tax=Muricoccus aerilatus TaxID=452982 RepID=UPI0005C20984|nr:hypothetical protein [Roseomonas aerilata]